LFARGSPWPNSQEKVITLKQWAMRNELKLKRNIRSLHYIKGQYENNANSKETSGHYITSKGNVKRTKAQKKLGHDITSKGDVERT